MHIRVAFTVATSLLFLSVEPAPAHAEEVRRTDAHGDAPASIDITNARYTHGKTRVSVVATIPRLGRAGQASLSISRYSIFEAGYVVLVKKRAGEAPRVRLAYFNHFELEPRRCSSLSGKWSNGQIRLGVARSCLKGHIRERVFVQFGGQRGSNVDRAPAVRRLARS